MRHSLNIFYAAVTVAWVFYFTGDMALRSAVGVVTATGQVLYSRGWHQASHSSWPHPRDRRSHPPSPPSFGLYAHLIIRLGYMMTPLLLFVAVHWGCTYITTLMTVSSGPSWCSSWSCQLLLVRALWVWCSSFPGQLQFPETMDLMTCLSFAAIFRYIPWQWGMFPNFSS